jgi:hypothetical protein
MNSVDSYRSLGVKAIYRLELLVRAGFSPLTPLYLLAIRSDRRWALEQHVVTSWGTSLCLEGGWKVDIRKVQGH